MSVFVQIILIAPLLFLGTLCRASEMRQPFQSVHSLGMGGVYTYSDSDASVIFRNPAGLAKISGMHISLFEIDFGLNNCSGVSGCSNADLFGNFNYTGISSISPYFGKTIWIGIDGIAAIALPNFGFGVFEQGYLGFRVENPAFPSLPISYTNDYGFNFGFSFPIGPDLSLGLGGKRVVRKGGVLTLGPTLLSQASDTTTLLNNLNQNGYGYGLDGGILFKPKIPLNPTLAISWQDMGSTAFIPTGSSTAPERIKDNLTLSTTIGAEIPGLGFSGGIEYRHITDNDEQLGKKIHVGAEVSLLMFDLRAGFYQGYTTYGVGLDLFFMQLDAATYTVERGAYPGQTPDQRIELALSMDLGFDPNLALTDAGGKRRKLKQRR